jgi:hypothetical protein
MSAFGLQDSEKAGEGSLLNFIVGKAQQSRKDAKAEKEKQEKILAEGGEVEEKDRKNLFGKALFHNFGGSAFTGTKNFSENFRYKRAEKESGGGGGGTSERPKVGDGLRKILVTGFGSLLTDTSQIQGGLAATKEVLNQQVSMQGMSADILGGIQGILSDQTENQLQIIESMKGGVSPGVGGGNKSSAFGNVNAQGAGEGSIFSFIEDQIQKRLEQAGLIGGGGAAGGLLSRFLFNPVGAYVGLATLIGGLTVWGQQQNKKNVADMMGPERIEAAKKKVEEAQKSGDVWKIQEALDNYNRVSGNDQLNPAQLNPSYSSGGLFKYAAGSTSMIGEAGKEAVVDLNSADARNQMNNKGGVDPSMKAVGGSLLSVTDAFIKALGPVGGPVAQTVGGDISNLAGTFGMSSVLSNLKIGGASFKDSSDAKRKRGVFLEDLISKSLEYLGAKKKDTKEAKTAPASGPGSTGTPDQKQKEEERRSEAMDDISPSGTTVKYKPGKDGQLESYIETKDDVAFRKIGTGIDPATNKPRDIMGPSINYRPVEGTNGTRFYDSDGELYARENNKFRTLTKTEKEKGWNGKPFMRSTNDGHVRVNPEDWFLGQGNLQRPPANGEYSYKWGKVWRLNPDGKINTPEGKGDWQDVDVPGSYGGNYSLPPTGSMRYEKGGSYAGGGMFDKLRRFITQGTGRVMAPNGGELGYQNKFLGWNVGDYQRLPLNKTYTDKAAARYNTLKANTNQPDRLEKDMFGRHFTYVDPRLVRTPSAQVKPAQPSLNTQAQGLNNRLSNQSRTKVDVVNEILGHEAGKLTTWGESQKMIGDQYGWSTRAEQTKKLKDEGYAEGGEKTSMFGLSGMDDNITVKTSRQLKSLENKLDALKYMIISLNNSMPKVSSASPKVSATSDEDTNYAPVLINMQSSSGGIQMPMTVPETPPETMSTYRRMPEPGGLAMLTSHSGTGVL